MTMKEQISELSGALDEFAKCIETLSEKAFRQKIDAWSPRDILAHLIGWNRNTIKGAKQIRSGELPFYFIDPGDDFSKINAVLIQEYASPDKQELLNELKTSYYELEQFLLTLTPADWIGDYGVRYRNAPVTIETTVAALIRDYVHHRVQIAEWIKYG